jgi:transglutaminase-like putative cysteine protease
MSRLTSLFSAGLVWLCFVVHGWGSPHAALSQGPTPDWAADPLPITIPDESATVSNGGLQYLVVDSQDVIPTQSSFRRTVYRVGDPSSLQNGAEISLGFDPSYEKLVLHYIHIIRDGQTTDRLDLGAIEILRQERDRERSLYDGRLTGVIQLKDVRVGDIVDYAYTRQGWNPVFGGRFSGSRYLGWKVPVQQFRTRLVSSVDRPLRVKLHGSSQVELQMSREGSQEVYEWRASPLKPTFADRGTPAWYADYPFAQFSEYKSWAEIKDWAFPLYDQPVAESLRTQAGRLRGADASSDDQILAALRFVQDDVRYLGVEMGENSHRPHPPAETLANRFGDCKDKALLLCTLLREMGFHAYPALVDTDFGSHLNEWLPSPLAFDHVIVQVERAGSSPLWLDATQLYQAGNLAQHTARDFGYALVVREGVDGLTRMERPDESLPRMREQLRFISTAFDQPTTLKVVTTYTGSRAASMRSYLADSSVEAVTRDYLNYYLKRYPAAESLRPVSWADDKAANSLVIEEEYKIPGAWTNVAGGKRQLYVSATSVQDYVAAPEAQNRTAPLGLTHPVDVDVEINLELPIEWPIQPDKISVNDPAFHYSSAATGTGNKIRLKYHYTSLTDHVEAERVAAYATNLGKVRDDLGYTLTHDPSKAAVTQAFHFNPWTVISTLLALSAAAYVAFKVLRRRGVDERIAEVADAPRIGGWLILLGIHAVVRPFVLLGSWGKLFNNYYDRTGWDVIWNAASTAYSPALGSLVLAETMTNSWLLVHSILAAVLFFQRRREARAWTMGLIAVSLVVVWADLLALHWISPENVSSNHWSGGINVGISAAIWLPYWYLSSRVKATFVR